jgi:hypothetical protein
MAVLSGFGDEAAKLGVGGSEVSAASGVGGALFLHAAKGVLDVGVVPLEDLGDAGGGAAAIIQEGGGDAAGPNEPLQSGAAEELVPADEVAPADKLDDGAGECIAVGLVAAEIERSHITG